MHRFQTCKSLSECWRKPFIGFSLVGEKGVATRPWHVESVKEGCPWRLMLVGGIAVPGSRIGSVVEELLERLVCSSSMYEMNFGKALGSAARRVNVQSAEIPHIFQCLFNGQ